MIRLLLAGLLLSCGGDISIVTVEKRGEDTAIVAEPEALDTQTSEPGAEDTGSSNPSFDPDAVIGYAEMHFKQISCPACVGAYGEFDIQAELLLHRPTAGNYFAYFQEVGTCTTQLIETQVSASPLQASQATTFNGITLNPVGSGKWLSLIHISEPTRRS